MAPHKHSKNKNNFIRKDFHRNLLESLFPCRFKTQEELYKQTMSISESSIFNTSDAEKLVKYIRQKHRINNTQRIFNDSPVAERSFPIEVQSVKEKVKTVSPLKHSTKEVSKFSNSRIPRANRRIGKRTILKEFEKASGAGENFQPAAFSTPKSMLINVDQNISGISRITRGEEIPENQELNEVPKTADNYHDYFQKISENNQAISDAEMHSVDRFTIVLPQEETLKNNEANNSKQNKSKSWKGQRSKRIYSALSPRMPLNGISVSQQNVLERPSDSDTCSESGDKCKDLARNQSTKSKYTGNKTTQGLQSIDSCVGGLNNEKEFMDSTSTVDAINKNDVFKEPTKPVPKVLKRKIGKKGNLQEIGKGNSNNAMQDSNPENSMEEKHQFRLVSRNKALKTNTAKKSTCNECNSLNLPAEPDEVDYHPEELIAISRTSVSENNNNSETRLSDIPENTKSMVRRTNETKDSDAKQSQENKKEKHSHCSKSKPMKSSHPSSEELSEPLRRITRQRKSPIIGYCCRRSSEEKMKTDKIAMNESHFAYQLFDWLKESFLMKSSTEMPESNKGHHKVVDQQETAPISSYDRTSISEENHHPKSRRCKAVLHAPTTGSGNQKDTFNDAHLNREDRLFLWLKNLSTLTRNKDIVRMLYSNDVKIGKVENLIIQEICGIEYAYYLREDNNYGYMKFHPHSVKPRARAKKFELKFLPLVGSLQIKIDETSVTIKNGDLVAVQKGMRYRISNPSNDSAILIFILHPTP